MTHRNAELKSSYAYCGRVARRAASSFYYAFYLLPSTQRLAMNALYAYLRKTDDLVDVPLAGDVPASVRRDVLSEWRQRVQHAFANDTPTLGNAEEPNLPALVDTVRRFEIPVQYLLDVIDGVESDIEPQGYETFADLEQYCYRVASVVGLACLHIWGFDGSEQALEPARKCGVAFQLTNILRDVAEDARRGRVYLPREDLDRFNCTADDLRQPVCRPQVRALMKFEIDRAASLFDEAAALHWYLSPSGKRIFSAMLATYRRLLHEIARRDGDVFTQRVRLPRWRRLQIVARSAIMPRQYSADSAEQQRASRPVETPTP